MDGSISTAGARQSSLGVVVVDVTDVTELVDAVVLDELVDDVAVERVEGDTREVVTVPFEADVNQRARMAARATATIKDPMMHPLMQHDHQ